MTLKFASMVEKILLTLFLGLMLSVQSAATFAETFTNPLILQRADPWVYKHSDGYYYFTASVPDYDRIILRRASSMQGLSSATEVTAWDQPASGPMSGFVWAPELHWIDGKWYIYYAASEANDIWDIRIYVLENTATNPLTGSWTEKGELKVDGMGNDSRFFALDSTTFVHNNQRYLLWAQIPPGGNSSLYIARMINPWTIDLSTQTMIATPEYSWEKIGHNVNEGPAILKRNGRFFVTFSASATDKNYKLGLLTADQNADLLDPASWHKNPEPIFSSNASTSQFGPGHNSFTRSADDSVDIMIYHARDYENISGEPLYDPNRHTRAKVITWNADGTPNFGVPYANGISGYSSLKSAFSGKCANIDTSVDGGTANGVDLVQQDCNGADSQTFMYESIDSQYFQLKAMHSNRCLDVYGQSAEDGANVNQWDCWGGNNQQWKKVDAGNGYFQLQNRNSQKCLDVFDWNNANGASLKQWSCNGYSVQKWQEIP
ncbi:family 43 glycosylhydrolase [Gynuella sunshinyii]|uniref:Putative beta-xylosidase n=1 Tax=Gynuella sunshinyii YC6258 TaxID=1445510 RepID=A0A0C5VS69_9GAMM|nr:family 43 glycosylhydrolase [Gynuella sunshinyii]AJQ96178.1 putative beta-xylosidase [Gynuella sunshinyii YC6258]